MIGRTVSHFKILEQLGQGGMGIVYKAVDTNLDRTVALKFLPAQFSSDEKSKLRFIQEAKAASALDHANICAIYEIGETEDKALFIAMAYYDGQTLKYGMGEEKFSVDAAVEIGRQLAAALDRAHESGIVHRDIKPANIMLTGRGEVKLLDFGLAKLAGGAELTVEGSTLGTAAYMSPEQARGSDVTASSDIWAVGAVMYEMLAGTKPFGGEYEQALIYGILNESPKTLTELGVDVSGELSDLIARCLSKKSEDRPTAHELMLQLGGSSGSRPAVEAAQPRPSPLNKPLLIALGIVFILAVSLAIWGIAGGRGDTTPSISRAVAGSGTDHSVAVLPFKLFSAADQETSAMFAGGMHNDVLTRLAKISGLRVIARTSVEQYEGTTKSAAVIAGELGVAAVLEGTIQRAGNRVRINVQLIDAKTESPLWGETYDEELTTENIFSIQSDLARSIATALETTLSPKEDQLLAERANVSMEAYDLFVSTKYRSSQISRNNVEEVKRVAADFEAVLRIEPDYAEAQAELASVYLAGIVSSVWSPDEKMETARNLAENALRLNPDLPESHIAMARVYQAELMWDAAEESFQNAIELAPNDADVLQSLSTLYVSLGRASEAVQMGRRAVELDPLNMGVRTGLLGTLMFGQQFEQTVAEAERTIRMDPNQDYAHYSKGFALVMLGRPLEGVPEFDEAIRLVPSDLFSKMGLAFAYAKAGNGAEAARVMSALPDTPAMLKEKAIVYGVFGDLDTAFDLLNRSFAASPPAATQIVGDPTVSQEMMADPRWAAFVEKVGL